MRLTEAQVREWIKRRLGCGVVGVELTDDQLDDSIDDAKIWWQMWIGQMKSTLLTLTGKYEYDDTDIASDVDSIVDVIFENSGAPFYKIFSWADVELNPFTYVYAGTGGYSELVQYLQYREMGQQIVSVGS